jgi:F420H(2)-dependent quinone reductase
VTPVPANLPSELDAVRAALEGEYEISPTGWVREQTEKIFETGTTESVGINGRAVVLLTTRGAKTGKLRKVPLMRVEHEGRYAIVASLGGAPKNPVWYYNVKADPKVELQDGTETNDFVAREVTGDEKAVWWERAVAAYPPYADYQRKTDREIPVFVLEPGTA